MKTILHTLLLFNFLTVNAQSISDENVDRIERYLDNTALMGFNGQVAISCKGDMLLNKSLGYVHDFSEEKITDTTVFGIASISKMFTAAAIAKLVESNKLTFDTRIGNILPNTPEDKIDISIHDLLTHSSGLPGGDIVDDFDDVTKEELLEMILASELESGIGEQFNYSNAGYNLLALTIERVSGKTYDAFLHDEFFKPLGMTHTGVIGTDHAKVQHSSVAQRGFTNNGGVSDWKFNMRTLGGGNIFSTASDLMTWDNSMKNNVVLNEKSTNILQSAQFRINDEEQYAYGWFLYKSSLGEVQEHGGDTELGYNGCFYKFLDHDITLIILNNKFENTSADLSLRWSVFYPIRDLLLRDKPISTNIEFSPLAVDLRSGSYRSEHGELNIQKVNGRYVLSPTDHRAALDLVSISDTTRIGVDSVALKTNELFTQLLDNNTNMYDTLLKEAAEYAYLYIEEWNSLTSEFGDLIGYKIISIIPDLYSNTIKSYTLLKFKEQNYYMSCRFLENGHGRLSGTNPVEELKIAKWFSPSRSMLEHECLFSQDHREIEVVDEQNIRVGEVTYRWQAK